MKIFEVISEDKKTWYKDGVEMCSKDCCGQPVTECTCGPDCKHCDCYEINKGLNEGPTGYGMRDGDSIGMSNASRRQSQADVVNVNKRINNQAADANREINISNKSINRRINRLQRKQATGIPQRLLNPQQPQAPEQTK
jgi:hypothetical protein